MCNLIFGESIWILIFLSSVLLGFYLNSVIILSLTLFILVLSALELGLGMLLLMSLRDEGGLALGNHSALNPLTPAPLLNNKFFI